MRSQLRIRLVPLLALLGGSLAFAPAASAHTEFEIGEYHLELGWLNEPAFVGQPNGVELTIRDHDEQPVTDLATDALTVVVSTAGQDSPALTLVPQFDVAEGFGTLGQYAAELVPTVPGEYTFHLLGTIHDEPVDLVVTSGEETFSPVRSSSDAEFPVKVPTLADVATRLDRIDGRIGALQADVPSAQELADLQTAASSAQTAAASAERTAMIGIVVGGAGVVVAVISLWLAMRPGRRGAGSA